jgi:hypothetical protein
MIRPLTCVTVLLACGSGLYLYQTKHQAQVLDKQIEHAVKLAAATRMQTRELTAAWTLLGSPDRLQQLSDQYIEIKPVAPSQFVSMSDLDSRLPAPRALPAPAADAPDDTGAGTIPLATNVPAAAPDSIAAAALTAPSPQAALTVAQPGSSAVNDAAKAAAAASSSRAADRKPTDMAHPPRDTAMRDASQRDSAFRDPISRDGGQRDVTLRDTPQRDVTPREPAPARDTVVARPATPRPVTPPMVAELDRPARQAPPRLPPMPVSGSMLGMAHTSVAAPVPFSSNGN